MIIIEKIKVAGEMVAMVYAYGPEGGFGYAALVTFSPSTPVITQLGEFADKAAANACVAAVAAQLRGLVRAGSLRIGACNPGHQEAVADPVCDCTGGPAHMVF